MHIRGDRQGMHPLANLELPFSQSFSRHGIFPMRQGRGGQPAHMCLASPSQPGESNLCQRECLHLTLGFAEQHSLRVKALDFSPECHFFKAV